MDLPFVGPLRRNHAVEHATVAILFERHGRIFTVFGQSDLRGFSLYGPVTRDEVEDAAREAVQRLRGGERQLALTHFCGTNLVATGVLAGGAALLVAGPNRRDRLGAALTAATAAAALAGRVGIALQRHLTTDAAIGALEVRAVREARRRGRNRRIRVDLG